MDTSEMSAIVKVKIDYAWAKIREIVKDLGCVMIDPSRIDGSLKLVVNPMNMGCVLARVSVNQRQEKTGSYRWHVTDYIDVTVGQGHYRDRSAARTYTDHVKNNEINWKKFTASLMDKINYSEALYKQDKIEIEREREYQKAKSAASDTNEMLKEKFAKVFGSREVSYPSSYDIAAGDYKTNVNLRMSSGTPITYRLAYFEKMSFTADQMAALLDALATVINKEESQ